MEGITAIAVSPSRRFVALAERGDKPTITIYDIFTLKVRQVLTTAECQAREFTCLGFSPDSHYLVTQGGAPDWNVFCWAWERNKTIAGIKSSNKENSTVTQASFNPSDNSLISVCGNNIFKLFRCSEGTLKQLPSSKPQLQNFLCHCWVSDEKIVAGTSTGELLLFDMAEFKASIPQSANDSAPITAIQPTSKGFICGTGSGMVYLYEKTDDVSYYRRRTEVQIAGVNVRVSTVAINPSETSVTAVMETNEIQVFTLNLGVGKLSKDPSLNFLSRTCHSRGITGLDVCMRKPLVVTCSTDLSIRIWNYKTNVVEVLKTFTEEVYSVAIHPMGHHLVAGFQDQIKFFNILMDDIQSVFEFEVRGCREIRFNQGGNLFAAAQGFTIYVYSTYTLESVASLKGHSHRIRSLDFSDDGNTLVSAGIDGAIYSWDTHSLKRKGEGILMRSTQYQSAVCTEDANVVYAVGTEKTVKQYVSCQLKEEFPLNNDAATVLCLSHGPRQLLFAGTASGAILSYRCPVTAEYNSYFCHSGAVTRMRVNRESSLLFTVGEDACLYVLDIRDPAGKIKNLQETSDFSDEVLTTKVAVEEKETEIHELKTKLEDQAREASDQLEVKVLHFEEKLKETADHCAQVEESWKQQLAALQQDKLKAEEALRNQMQAEKVTAEKKMEAMGQKYQSSVVAEGERYKDLREQKQEMEAGFEEDIKTLKETHSQTLSEKENEWAAKLRTMSEQYELLVLEKQRLVEEFNATRRAIEEDADSEITTQKTHFDTKLANEVQLHINAQNAKEQQIKRNKQLQKDIEGHLQQVAALQEEKKSLQLQIQALEKDRELQRLEMREWDYTLREKDKRISDLKKQNSELEKIKFVLDTKIMELSQKIEPLDVRIGYQNEQIEEMNEELGANHKKFSEMNFFITTQKTQLAALQKQANQLKSRLTTAQSYINRFKADLHKMVSHIQDAAMLKDDVKRLYEAYGDDTVKEAAVTDDIREYARQRAHLEQTIATLRKQSEKDAELHHRENMRIIQENVQLLGEINDLRKELKMLKLTSGVYKERDYHHYQPKVASSARSASTPPSHVETEKLLEMQKEEIRRLHLRVQQLEEQLKRPSTRPLERLPPMEGFTTAVLDNRGSVSH
eukprot:TRINITY_DN2918_c0_g1_i4.p1 TRINITY_DN2918_c0_g1~~TRINITY_DN2918_c0_g1_i4.p1  ORF type:complete len:1229 (+),score=377.24 TRINITY_DN2918_c0_g1_i4:296-3688(+)